MQKILTISLGLLSVAGATEVEVGGNLSCLCPHFHAELRQFPVLNTTTLGAGASDQSVWLGSESRFDLGVGGNLSASFKARYAYTGYYRLEGQLGGVLGSKATVNLQARYATLGLVYFDQREAFVLDPEVNRSGLALSLDSKYRLDRQWTLYLTGAYGVENRAQLGAQYRTGNGEYRVAAAWQQNDEGDLFGVAPGFTWREDNSLATLDLLIGMENGEVLAGGKASVGVYALEDFFDSDVRVFAAYEPYREAVFPLRYGVETLTPLGPGKLGITAAFTPDQYSVQASYRWSLDAPEEELNE